MDESQAAMGRGRAWSGQAGGGPYELAIALAETAGTLNTATGVDATVHAVVAAGVRLIPGTQSAGLTQAHRRGREPELDVQFATDPFGADLDTAQHSTGQGPRLEKVGWPHTPRVQDFATEQRWPAFTAQARALGAGSMLSLPLSVKGDGMAALHLYSRQANAFTDQSQQIGLLFAAHAAIALAGAQHEADLHQSVESRDIIGQAKGILMQRHKIDADQAFEVLVRTSADTNIRLRDVAETIAETGTLPTRH